LKTVAFTVRGTMAQGIRWKQAAEADGHRSVGTWLAEAADSYLKARARAGRPIPLAWRRHARFRVDLPDGSSPELIGWMAPPFGIFRGDAAGLGYCGCNLYSLVYLPDRRLVATLRRAQQCRALASELAIVLLREDRELAAGIVERHRRESI
jgi:hypothetical protein